MSYVGDRGTSKRLERLTHYRNNYVEETEESYTSKCDHLALDLMKKQENYLGKRVKRGLFQSSIGKLLNADIQGAIGISLKKYPAILNEIVGSGLVFRPYSINIF